MTYSTIAESGSWSGLRPEGNAFFVVEFAVELFADVSVADGRSLFSALAFLRNENRDDIFTMEDGSFSYKRVRGHRDAGC